MSRPAYGTGGFHVRIKAQVGSGWQVFIARELWRAIGSPRRVAITRRGNVLHLAPTTEDDAGTYALSSGAWSMPRCSVGPRIVQEEWRLTAGYYDQCRVAHGEIIVFV